LETIASSAMMLIMRGWVGPLYPNRKTAERLHQTAFLGNRLLDAENAEYAATE